MADRIKGITIEIGGDTTGLSNALKGVNSNIKSTQNQLKDVERLLKLDPSNTELLSQKQRLLSQAVEETKGKLDTLKEAERQAQQQFAEGRINQEQYEALQREIIETEQQLERLEGQAENSSVALQKIGLAGEKMKEFGGKVTAVGQELSKVSAGLAAVGTAAVAAWGTLDEAYDTIAKGTGATGEALEGLQKSFDNVFSSIPTDAATAGSAIADINTRFGFTGEAVEECTKKFIQFGEVNNTDVSTAIANVSRYMGDASIDSSKYSEVLDQLTAASQGSGLSVDKLSDSLTKYGAPMRALGFETQESIAIFAGWEKAGVNTEIAFSGMKKAIGTWGKQGKDARKEFKKTLDEIAACPDIAKATSKAIEVFGQKAGPDLADAIQGGRFAYEDFLEIIENSKGQLEQTFNDTLDPIDDVHVAIQGLTTQGAELGGALLKTLAPMITAVVDKLKELTTWFQSLDDSQKETVVKIGLVVAAIGPLLIVLGQMATGIGAIMTAVSTLGPLLATLGAASGPIALVAAAVGALALVFNDAANYTSDYYIAASELTDQEIENKAKADELCASYEQLNQQRQFAADNVGAEAQREKDLFAELQSITNENGKVQAGYEERAAFIVGELSSALGTEISMTGNQIQNYKDLCANIDTLIQKKQANALLSAQESAYADAITNQTEATVAYYQAKGDVADKTWELLKAQQAEAEATDNIRQLLQESTEKGIAPNEYALQELAQQQYEAAEKAKGYAEALGGLKETLTNAETAYTGYNNTIANYEGLSSAIISGDQQKISDAILMTSNSFQTAENSTRESLERQVQTFQQKYQELKTAVDNGAPPVVQAQADSMKKMVELSKAELDKLPHTADQPMLDMINVIQAKEKELGIAGQGTGKYYTDGLSGGIEAGIGGVTSAAEKVAQASVDEANRTLGIQSPSRVTHETGVYFSAGFADGIEFGSAQVTSAVKTVAEGAAGELSNALQGSQSSTESYQKTMTSGWSTWAASLTSQLRTVLSELVATTKTSMDSLNSTVQSGTNSTGQTWIKSWEDVQSSHKTTMESIKNVHESVMKTVESLNRKETDKMREDAVKAFRDMDEGIRRELGNLPGIVQSGVTPATNYLSNLKNSSPIWGKDMMSGFISGVRSKIGELERACREAANTVSDYLHHTTPEKGPMKDDDAWMPDMMDNFSEGIHSNLWKLEDQARALASTMQGNLTGIQDNGITQGADNNGAIIELLNYYLPSIAEQKYITMDGKAIVGQTISEMDRQLGEMQKLKWRTI